MGQFEDLSKVINDNFVALKNQYTQFDADRKNDIAALNTKEDKNFQALWNWCDALQKTVIKMAESEALQAPQIEKAIADADKALKAAQASPSLSTEQLSSVSWITKQLEKIRNFFK